MHRLLYAACVFAFGLSASPALADHYDRRYYHDHDDDAAVGAVVGGIIGAVTGYAIGSRHYGYVGGYYGYPGYRYPYAYPPYGYRAYGYPVYGYAVPAYPPPPVYGYYGTPYRYGYYGGPYGGYAVRYGNRYAYRRLYYGHR